MDAHHYSATRQAALKETFRARRKKVGYSQQDIADLLGCARSRIATIEDPDTSACYSIGEMELLASLFGDNPLELLRTSGPDALALTHFVTEHQTKDALLDLVDCVLPAQVEELYSQSDEWSPDPVLFSPSGAIIVALVDQAEAEDWDDWQDSPYIFTILCWDVRSGALLAERRLPYVESLAVVDDNRIVITTARPVQEELEEQDDPLMEHTLEVWNFRGQHSEEMVLLLERVGNLAVSTDGGRLAAFFPRTTTIQCWQTSDWAPTHAFELESHHGPLDTPGNTYLIAKDVQALPRERKVAPWVGDYQASRFAFMDEHQLVFGYGRRLVEFDLQEHADYPSPIMDHPVIPWTPLLHHRDAQQEIAVMCIEYDVQRHETQVELAYVVPRSERHPYGIDTSVQLNKRFPGAVWQPLILDASLILAVVEYDTAVRWGMAYKQRLGLCNLISGQVVLLSDGGQLRDGDNQLSARISPKGDTVAYWVCPDAGAVRLMIQSIKSNVLQVKGLSLVTALEQSRTLLRMQMQHG
jgi:transcriptional regulator with XRE-family HTH domain